MRNEEVVEYYKENKEKLTELAQSPERVIRSMALAIINVADEEEYERLMNERKE